MLIVSDPAPTRTSPALPLLNPDWEVMPVKRFCPLPSITKAPATLTVTLPAAPVPPSVSTEITPLLTMLRLPALTATLPASPLLPISAVMPVGTIDDMASTHIDLATVTTLLPALQIPKVSVVIC